MDGDGKNSFGMDDSSDVSVDFELPPRFKVVFLNDVVYVLMKVFHRSEADAAMIMEKVHKTGRGVAGVYDYDMAATRAQMAMSAARENGFPLKCKLEKE